MPKSTSGHVTVHETLPSRVLVGRGARREIPGEIERLGAEQVLLVSTGSAQAAAGELAEALGSRLAACFDRPVVHTPLGVTAEVMGVVEQTGADSVVAIGGGSAIGLAKAVAARTGMAQIAVPTTYAGSEVTPVLGETADGVKTTRRDPAIAPGTVVYDAELTVTMPGGLTLTSSLNALAHSVEAFWAQDATAVTDGLATESIQGILGSLPEVLANPSGVSGCERLQSAAWLAGLCLAQTQMGLHHQLAHALGGTFGLPHAELHAMLLATCWPSTSPQRRRQRPGSSGSPAPTRWPSSPGSHAATTGPPRSARWEFHGTDCMPSPSASSPGPTRTRGP